MHELTLLNNVMKKIEAIAAENNVSSVEKVCLEVGALAHISAEHLREHFEIASRGTVAAESELEITTLEDTQHPLAQEIVLKNVVIPT